MANAQMPKASQLDNLSPLDLAIENFDALYDDLRAATEEKDFDDYFDEVFRDLVFEEPASSVVNSTSRPKSEIATPLVIVAFGLAISSALLHYTEKDNLPSFLQPVHDINSQILAPFKTSP